MHCIDAHVFAPTPRGFRVHPPRSLKMTLHFITLAAIVQTKIKMHSGILLSLTVPASAFALQGQNATTTVESGHPMLRGSVQNAGVVRTQRRREGIGTRLNTHRLR